MGLKEELLKHYGLSEAEYASFILPADIRNIPFIDSEPSVLTAIKRINKAIDNHEKILIYGDYDCDGIMATSILTYAFSKLGQNVATYIPSRYLDGYGLTLDNAKKIAAANYDLIILVDNGVSSLEPIAYLLNEGKETIIIDHHELPSSLPPSLALIHPYTLKYGSYPVSAGYLSFLFASALLKEIDPYLLILGALSTISDMMPLKGHNREIVRLALDYLNRFEFKAINRLTKNKHIDEDVLSLEIIPKINAIGRVIEDHTINRTVTYFAYPSNEKAEALAAWMEETNKQRKELSFASFNQTEVDNDKPGVFVITDLKEGLNGLLANRLMQAYQKPTIVMSPSKSDPSAYVGSLRSQEGFLFPEFAEYAFKYLLRYGGHGHAGGFSLKKEEVEGFKDCFYQYCSSHPLLEVKSESIELDQREITPGTYRLISSFGPFGFEWKKPEFIVKGLPTESLRYSRDENHVSAKLPSGIKLLGFNMPKKEISQYTYINIEGSFSVSEFMGVSSIEFRINRYSKETN